MKNGQVNSHRVFNTKLGLVALLPLILFVLLFSRLVDIQLVKGLFFLKQAEENRFFTVYLPADRGVLLDRFGQPLVLNMRSYLRKLQPHALHSPIEPLDKNEAMQLIATDSAQVETQLSRIYPRGESLAHVIGYVGKVSAEDLTAGSGYKLTDNLGKMGLELIWDQRLRGQSGQEILEVDARSTKKRSIDRIEAVGGSNVQTSLDADVSEIAYRALGERKGSVVILDASSGQVVSLVSRPSFDPQLFQVVHKNDFEKDQQQASLVKLFQSEDRPFFNRSIDGEYPPGSVFKLVTALAGLETGAIDDSSTVDDEGTLKVGEYEYGNWYFRQYGKTEGEIGLVRSIARSNDIFFYKAAEWTGPEKIAEMASFLGLGARTGIELRPEADGLVPTPAWKEKVLKEPWYLGNTYHLGIGQGDLLVTPIQMAQLLQSIGNEGQRCRPGFEMKDSSECMLLGLREESLKIVLKGMLDACSTGGTAYPFFPRNEELRDPDSSNPYDDLHRGAVACKTGTAEFGAADNRGYRPTHGWWAGVVEPRIPQELPEGVDDQYQAWWQLVQDQGYPSRLAIVVMVESDEDQPYMEGSRDAAPVAKEVLDWMEQGEVSELVSKLEI